MKTKPQTAGPFAIFDESASRTRPGALAAFRRSDGSDHVPATFRCVLAQP